MIRTTLSCVVSFFGIALFFSACSQKAINYVPPKYLSTYYDIDRTSLVTLKDTMYASGFKLLSEEHTKSDDSILVYTHSILNRYAEKKKRSFLATVLRVLVDNNSSHVRMTNPEYFIKAYLDESYVLGDGSTILERLLTAFPNAIQSPEKVLFKKLENYTFMTGMPTYKDSVILYKASTLNEVLDKLNNVTNKSRIAYKHKIEKDTMIVGVESKEISNMLEMRLGKELSLLFPWPVSITAEIKEEKKIFVVKTLDPKYQIALYYPALTLETFFPIITLPDMIEEELKRLFD